MFNGILFGWLLFLHCCFHTYDDEYFFLIACRWLLFLWNFWCSPQIWEVGEMDNSIGAVRYLSLLLVCPVYVLVFSYAHGGFVKASSFCLVFLFLGHCLVWVLAKMFFAFFKSIARFHFLSCLRFSLRFSIHTFVFLFSSPPPFPLAGDRWACPPPSFPRCPQIIKRLMIYLNIWFLCLKPEDFHFLWLRV